MTLEKSTIYILPNIFIFFATLWAGGFQKRLLFNTFEWKNTMSVFDSCLKGRSWEKVRKILQGVVCSSSLHRADLPSSVFHLQILGGR